MDVVSSFGHWRRSRVLLGIYPGSGAGERAAREAFPAATILCPGVMFADDGGDERRHDDRQSSRATPWTAVLPAYGPCGRTRGTCLRSCFYAGAQASLG